MGKLRGFTLVELLVVIAIVAVLVSMAVPSIRHLTQSVAISNGVNTFMSDLRYARSEAIQRGGRVIMCRSDSPEAASPACGSGATSWSTGWIVFYDANDNAVWNSGERILRVQAPISEIDSITEGGAGSTKFRFTATGRLVNLSSATTLNFGGSQFLTAEKRVVCVSLGGYVRIAGPGGTACS